MELARKPKGVQGGSSNASLTHYLRLVVCSYLPLETLVTKIASLNNYERRGLHNSAIARGNRSFQLSLWEDGWHRYNGPVLPARAIDYACSLISELEIEIKSDTNDLSKELHAKLTDQIVRLPSSFDNAKLTLRVYYIDRRKMLDLDKVCIILSKSRPNLVFKSFELFGPEEGEPAKFEANSTGLNYFIQKSKKIKLKFTYVDLRKFRVINEECLLKRLSLFKSSFHPAKRTEGEISPISLTSYSEIATCSSPERFEDLT